MTHTSVMLVMLGLLAGNASAQPIGGLPSSLRQLSPVLFLVLVVLLLWLAARLLRQGLLGRIGQLAKFVIAGGLVGLYAIAVLLKATGTLPPWARHIELLMPRSPGVTFVVIVSVIGVWLIVREVPFRVPAQLGFLLENPVRRLLAPAESVLSRIALGPGMRVVEIGCGTGYLSVEVAERIEPGGVLFCVDIQPRMVEKTMARVEKRQLRNVTGVPGPAHKLPVDIYDIDLVFMVHTLGEIDDRLAALREAERVLRPGAVLSISESLLDPHYRFRNDVARLCRQAGFEPVSVEGSLFGYTATFRKPKQPEPLGYVPRFS